MAAPYSREAQDALQALDRLVNRHKLLTLDQGKVAARLITGDENVEFPPPRAPPPAPTPRPAPEAPPQQPAAAEPAPETPQPAAEPGAPEG